METLTGLTRSRMLYGEKILWLVLLLLRRARSEGGACDAQSDGPVPTFKGYWVSLEACDECRCCLRQSSGTIK